MPDDIDAPDPHEADVTSDVDDLLRDIGAACGVGLDPAEERERPSDWFSQAVDQLAAGKVPDLASTGSVGGGPDVTDREPGSQEIPGAATPSTEEPLAETPPALDGGDAADAVVADRTHEPPSEAPLGASSTVSTDEAAVEAAVVVEAGEDPFGGAVFFEAPGEALGLASEPSETTGAPEAQVAQDGPRSDGGFVGDAALRRLDDDLADDVEDLLQGSFDTVSAVLEDSFGDTAAPAHTPEPVPAPASLETPEAEAADATPAEADPVDAGPADAGPADAGPADAGPADAGPADAGPADPGAAEPEPAGHASEPLPVRKVVDTEHLPQTVSELMDPRAREPVGELLPDRPTPAPADVAPEPEPEPEPESVPAPEPADVTPPPSDDRPPERAIPPESPASPSGWRAVLMELLAIISYPMRLVPPPLRPVVDWIALSLVFWVPIVWVIALFMVGQRT